MLAKNALRHRTRSLLKCIAPRYTRKNPNQPAVPDTALQPLIDLRALRLTTALALIEQSTGQAHSLPHAAGGAERYLQSVIDSLCELSLRDPLTGLARRWSTRPTTTASRAWPTAVTSMLRWNARWIALPDPAKRLCC